MAVLADQRRVLKLLLWKNFVIRRRHWLISSLFQVIIPLLIFGCIQIPRDKLTGRFNDFNSRFSNNDQKQNMRDEYFPKLTKNEFIEDFFSAKPRFSLINLYFAPQNYFTEDLMKLTASCLSFPNEDVKGFTSEKELLLKYSSNANGGDYLNVKAIIFKNVNALEGSKQLYYTIRPQNIYRYSSDHANFEYFLQACLDQSFLQMKFGAPVETNMSLQKMPSLAFKEKKFDDDFSIKFMYTVVAVLVFSIQLNVEIIYPSNEKNLGINVLMAMNGVKNYQSLLSWLISGLLFSVLYIVPRVIFLCVCFYSDCQPLLYYGNAILVIFMHFLNIIHLLSFGYHVSSYFSKSVLRVLANNFIYLGTFGLQIYFMFLIKKYNVIPPYMGIFFPNLLLFRIYEEMYSYEEKMEGVHWSNMFYVADVNNTESISLGVIAIFSILGTLFHFLLALYVSEILPGKYGVAKQPLYFLKCFKQNKNSSQRIDNVDYNRQNTLFEPVSTKFVPGIQIRNLKKSYIIDRINQTKKQALAGISIDFYKGEITTLLGHNGAGKTTLMSILTGLLSPSEGSVFINGKNISEEMKDIVTDLGLCPQENILFPDLTVFEQLQFFSMLRNGNNTKAQRDIDVKSLLQRLNIYEKMKEFPSKLSGGQKRRVCLGISLIGDASILILDEPTSGMDPETRREFWDILLKLRGEKTILISTHNMEEADILGDRTALIEQGKLRSYGTPLFLKKFYGGGNMEVTLSTEDVCDIDRIINQLPDQSRLINSDQGKIIFSVPFTEQLPEHLDRIEEKKHDLGITGISVSLITLEQVFLRATKEDNDNLEEKNFPVEKFDKIEGFERFKQSFIALILKKCAYVRKNIITHLLMIIIPLLSIFAIRATFIDSGEIQNVSFRLDMYSNPQVFYSSNDYTDYYGEKYKTIVENLNGRATEVNDNVSNAIVNFGRKDYADYRNNLIGGAEFKTEQFTYKKEVNVLYSEYVDNSVQIMINLVSNTILKKLLGDDHQIYASREQLRNENSFKFYYHNDTYNYVRALLMLLCLSPTFALYVIQPLKESITGLKKLQKMTGVTGYLYWGSFYLFDLFFFLLTIIIVYIFGFYIMDINGNLQLFHSTEIGVMFLLLILFALNMLPFIYMFSFWSKKTSIIFSVLTFLPALLLALEWIVFKTLRGNTSYKLALEQRAIEKKFFMIMPSLSFFYGVYSFFEIATRNADCRRMPEFYLYHICSTSRRNDCCDLNCSGGQCEKYFDYFNNSKVSDSLEKSILYLCLTPFIYFTIIGILEKKLIPRLFIKIKNIVPTGATQRVDDQVKAEKIFVASEINKFKKQDNPSEIQRSFKYNQFLNDNKSNNSIYLAYELSKYYGSLAAVKEISFSVKKKECFGLLGVNGAGKSTAFRLLTGEEFPNTGIMYLNGKEISKNREEYLEQMGYCPQNSALLESLNSEDHLELFALLRGVPRDQVKSEVDKWIKRLKLNLCANQPSGTYSGGNKRRLSIAIALIGNPNLVLMDEPTTGVDPAARRYMWHVIKSCQSGGQSFIFTSHSMEECEALCNRLAIMINGSIIAIGATQQLKHKFEAGFNINVKLNPERTEENVRSIKNLIEKSIICDLCDEHMTCITYHVRNSSIKWRKMYSVMQNLKEKYNCIVDYTITSGTLEQLFLQCARSHEKPIKVEI
ncbi:phospholipid-transporting ATPase ABCA1-like [Leptopilina heterotoma]|uniref:phospholipid-transporting ATPase ABCA1-like n=1 Tax=Leptopilina heterotoma TaxID=63436 RepID=UPI001CA9567D|nr:phospholipid-transporting ATPase ABCA1-like [Leptopilina heterotoma]